MSYSKQQENNTRSDETRHAPKMQQAQHVDQANVKFKTTAAKGSIIPDEGNIKSSSY
jgi:hypothetical protein